MAIVGLFARLDQATRAQTVTRLNALESVATFEIDDRYKIGLLVESESLDAAHACVREEIEPCSGVLGVWPSFASIEDELNLDDLVPVISQTQSVQ
ncbi:MAG: hypothetical protein DHS20C16_24990 [Phycisphaerae bacterium]|nr:MAG: hypothetical protein DHS20C16_24990 [Phycisphaerae bacterium]